MDKYPRETLLKYEALLKKWNKAINLVSRSTLDSFFARHIEDSMQLINYLDENWRIIDIGSGGGLPAIVLSIVGFQVTMIESDSRKAAFLAQAGRLGNQPEILNDRVENLHNLSCDVITARAFASLNKIFEYSKHITVKEKYLLHKGERYQQEIEEAKLNWDFDVILHDSVVEPKGKILEITNVKSKS